MKFMPPKEKTIIPPPDGWKQQTFYIVEASFSSSNPVHRYIFYTGFLNGGKYDRDLLEYVGELVPGGYNCFLDTEDKYTISRAHYLYAVHELAVDELHGGVSTLDDKYNLVEDYQPNRKEFDA